MHKNRKKHKTQSLYTVSLSAPTLNVPLTVVDICDLLCQSTAVKTGKY